MTNKCYKEKKFKGMDRYLVTPDEKVMVYYDKNTYANPWKVYAIINNRKNLVTEFADFLSVTYVIQSYINSCKGNTQLFKEYCGMERPSRKKRGA